MASGQKGVTPIMDVPGLPARRPSHDALPDGLHAGCDCGTQPDPPDPWRRGFTRRRMLQGSSALVAAMGLQTLTARYAFSAAATPSAAAGPGAAAGAPALNTDTIVMINLRGGWDSLNIVVPSFEPEYAKVRPNIAIPGAAGLPLSGGFTLHPALKDLHQLYKAGSMAFVVGVGTPDRTLSHFEAMDTLERGTAAGANDSGWLNRVLTQRSQDGVFSAVQLGTQVPLALAGPAQVLAMESIATFGLQGYDDVKAKAVAAYRALYRGLDHPLAAQVKNTLTAVGTVDRIRARPYTPANGATYPTDSRLGDQLKDVARLVKAKAGLTVATLDVGGWDMHTDEGGLTSGSLRFFLAELNAALSAFTTDLGATGMSSVTVLLVSEFGRTVAENGSVGTDHGHGQTMWVLGGGIRGGKIYGTWPGLAAADQFINGSLGATVDYRDVLADVLRARGGVGAFGSIFPDHRVTPLGLAKRRPA